MENAGGARERETQKEERRRDKKLSLDVSAGPRGTFEKISRETLSFSFFFFFFFSSGEEVRGRKARKGEKKKKERVRIRERERENT